MAVDEKDSTYWASKFDAEAPQSFILDFGSKKKLQSAVTPIWSAIVLIRSKKGIVSFI